jgi:hypothetical protein
LDDFLVRYSETVIDLALCQGDVAEELDLVDQGVVV